MRLRIALTYRSWLDTSLVDYLAEQGLEIEVSAFYAAPRTVKFSSKGELILLYLRILAKLCVSFHRYRHTPILSINGHYPLMVLTRLFGPLLPPSYHLYIWNIYLHGLGKNTIVKMILRFLLASKRITIIAQSPGDLRYFSDLSSNEVHFVSYGEDDRNVRADFGLVPDHPYIFAGGYSNRDYGAILDCARIFPDQHFLIAASDLNRDFVKHDLTPNVMVFWDIDPEKFQGLLERSKAVVVPLKEDVGSSGQMVCIAGMRSAKPIIYTDISAVNYLFDETSGIPYRMGSLKSLTRAVREFSQLKSDEVAAIGNNARSRFLQNYTKKVRNEQIFRIIRGQDLDRPGGGGKERDY